MVFNRLLLELSWDSVAAFISFVCSSFKEPPFRSLPRVVMLTIFIWYFNTQLPSTFDIIFSILRTVCSNLYLLYQVCALKKQEGADELAWVNPTEVR